MKSLEDTAAFGSGTRVTAQAGHGMAMSTAEIKARIEAMFADRAHR